LKCSQEISSGSPSLTDYLSPFTIHHSPLTLERETK
jgi:hypothetical protein